MLLQSICYFTSAKQIKQKRNIERIFKIKILIKFTEYRQKSVIVGNFLLLINYPSTNMTTATGLSSLYHNLDETLKM
jgi:hypothetical protein